MNYKKKTKRLDKAAGRYLKCGIKRLAFAMIHQAYNDVWDYDPRTTVHKDAVQYIHGLGDDEHYAFSFRNCCRLLELDPQAVAKTIGIELSGKVG